MIENSSRQILIAGGTGLIGQELVKALIFSGYKIVVLTRSSSSPTEWINNQSITSITWSGDFTSWLVREVEKSVAVINLAGENIATKRWSSHRKKQLIQSRMETTKALTKACQYASKKPNVFIQASAIGFYPSSNNETFSEDSEPGIGFLSQLTSDWETVVKNEIPKSVRLVIIRTGVVLSTKGGMLQKLVKPINFFVGGWFGSGEQVVSWIHIKDEVDAILHLLKNSNAEGLFNLVAPNPQSQKQLVKAIAKATNRIAWLPIPSILVKLIFGSMAKEVLLSGNHVESKKLSDLGFTFSYPTIDSALNNLMKS
jgi:uncharacterized protein (TIGR01777 family)